MSLRPINVLFHIVAVKGSPSEFSGLCSALHFQGLIANRGFGLGLFRAQSRKADAIRNVPCLSVIWMAWG